MHTKTIGIIFFANVVTKNPDEKLYVNNNFIYWSELTDLNLLIYRQKKAAEEFSCRSFIPL